MQKGTGYTISANVGMGLPPERMNEVCQIMFKRFGYIWKDYIPGRMTIVSCVKSEDVEK